MSTELTIICHSNNYRSVRLAQLLGVTLHNYLSLQFILLLSMPKSFLVYSISLSHSITSYCAI